MGNISNIPSTFWQPFITFFLGLFGGVFLERVKNRLVYLRQKLSIQHVALTGQTPGWGNIQILYNGSPSNNLYSGYAELANDSHLDLDSFIVHLSVNTGAVIYQINAQSLQDGITNGLVFEPEYRQYSLDVQNRYFAPTPNRTPAENATLMADAAYVSSNKIFVVPFLNRKTKLIFSFLVDNAHNAPDVIITVQKKGVKIINEQDDEKRKLLRTIWLGVLSMLLFIGSAFPTIRYAPSQTWAVWAMILNSVAAYLIAWPLYYFGIWVKKNVINLLK